jgi:hypothetical protein
MLINPFRFDSAPVQPAETVLQVSWNGSDAATSSTDESPTGHTLTFVGNAQLDTAQKQFGTASLLLDGTGDRVTAADHADFEIGSSDFTLEGWFRWANTPTSNEALLSKFNGSTNQRSFLLFWENTGTRIKFLASNNGSANQLDINWTWTPTANTWYHICVDYDGTKYRLYVDGTMRASSTAATVNIFNGTAILGIGDTDEADMAFDGWIDETRILNGLAAYASDSGFTVPTEEFPE